MSGLLHLVQRGGDWARPQPAQAPPRCTNVTAHPSTACVPITVLLYNGRRSAVLMCPLKGSPPAGCPVTSVSRGQLRRRVVQISDTESSSCTWAECATRAMVIPIARHTAQVRKPGLFKLKLNLWICPMYWAYLSLLNSRRDVILGETLHVYT